MGTDLLWALGEIGDPAAVPTLIGYVGRTSGAAFGGLYLAAMDAPYKLGAEAEPALERAVPPPAGLGACAGAHAPARVGPR